MWPYTLYSLQHFGIAIPSQATPMHSQLQVPLVTWSAQTQTLVKVLVYSGLLDHRYCTAGIFNQPRGGILDTLTLCSCRRENNLKIILANFCPDLQAPGRAGYSIRLRTSNSTKSTYIGITYSLLSQVWGQLLKRVAAPVIYINLANI